MKQINPEDFRESICEKVSSGMSLSAVCRLPEMPARSTVNLWILNDATFRASYEQAVTLRGEFLAEQLSEIADEQPPEFLAPHEMSGWIARQRLRVDVAKWSASKLARRYADKLEIQNKHMVEFDLRGVLEQRDKYLADALEGECRTIENPTQPAQISGQIRACEALPEFLTVAPNPEGDTP